MSSQAATLSRRGGAERRLSPRLFLQRYGAAYLFVAPFFILYAAFGLYPLF